MCRLTRLYAANVLKAETITSVGNNLHQVSFEREGQLNDEILGVGSNTWGVLAEVEEEYDSL